MRILALRLANLASLPGPLELDFTAAPLADAGLFAITGPTGAGKSTLLDALCLALYGSTPRLRQAPVRDAALPDVAGETVGTADPRTLLRRGSASGHAEVDFLGRDGRRYRARWAVRRAREKVEGRLQAVEQSLTDLDDGRLLTAQKREFDRLLPERLGLTFDQFTRAVLLAQSEFAAFLKADDNQRSDLLERLTGTAEYSQISMAAYRRASTAKKTVDGLENRLADDLPAEPQARAELEHAATTTQRALTHLNQQEARLKEQQRWHIDDTRLHEAYRQGEAEHQAAEAAWHALTEWRADREFRRLITPQRHRLLRQAALPDDIAALKKAHNKTHQALEQAKTLQHSAEQQRDQATQALNEANSARRQAEPTLRQAREHTQVLATLAQQLAELRTRQNNYRRQAETLTTQHSSVTARQREHLRQRDEWQATLHQLVGNYEQLDTARHTFQQTHDQAAHRSLALSELENRWQQACRNEQALQTLTQQLQTDEARQAELTTQGKTARQQLDVCEQHYTTLHDFIERSRAARSESVTRLREALQENAPCPVCGGLDHPFRQQPPVTPEAAQLAAQQAQEDAQLATARQARDEAQQTRNHLEGEYRAQQAAITRCRQEQQQAEQRLAQTQQALTEHPLYSEFKAVDASEGGAWITSQRQQSEALRDQQAAALQTLTRAEREIAPLEAALRQDELDLAQLETQRNTLTGELTQLEEQLPPLQQQYDQLSDQLASLLGEHASADSWQQWLEARQQRASQERDQAIERCHTAERDQAQLAQQAQHEAQRLEQLTHEQSTLEQELTTWRQAHPQLDDATLARLLAQPEAEVSHQEHELDATEARRQRSEVSLAERRRALIEHRRPRMQEEGADGVARLDDATLLSAEYDTQLAQQRETLDAERQALMPQLTQAQQARDSAVFVLNDDDRRRQRQQAGQTELKQARAEYVRWGRISELIGSADGKAFRRIAQAYNLEQLLEHANAHLGNLSRRYRLARGGSELGLLVVDRDMGDERRSVHSLSGGETFLVSLALALGLASMASGELVIESLFIDEGFGSLDPHSLALAMEALDGLQALGRRVGVISHVQEMHERIPVQIQVEPLGNGTSRTQLVTL